MLSYGHDGWRGWLTASAAQQRDIQGENVILQGYAAHRLRGIKMDGWIDKTIKLEEQVLDIVFLWWCVCRRCDTWSIRWTDICWLSANTALDA